MPVTLDHMVPLVRAVVAGAPHALVVADLVFGSYEASDEQAVHSAVRLMKEGGAHAVKLEGGVTRASRIRAVVAAGIPVMGHVGFTRRPSTPSAGTACRAAEMLRRRWSRTRRPSPRRARSRSSWRWSRPTSPGR